MSTRYKKQMKKNYKWYDKNNYSYYIQKLKLIDNYKTFQLLFNNSSIIFNKLLICWMHIWADHWTEILFLIFQGFWLIPCRSITRMFLEKFSTFLCRSQRLSSKIPSDFGKTLCSIALLILRKPLGIYMKRQ